MLSRPCDVIDVIGDGDGKDCVMSALLASRLDGYLNATDWENLYRKSCMTCRHSVE